jgi:hypothetical protein
MSKIGSPWHHWSAADEAKLWQLAVALGATRVSMKSWYKISAQFQGRSATACKQHYHDMRRDKAGETLSPRKQRERRANGRILRGANAISKAPETALLYHTPFAEMLGEPAVGRSALDRKLAGIIDEPAPDHRSCQMPAPVTLATGESA